MGNKHCAIVLFQCFFIKLMEATVVPVDETVLFATCKINLFHLDLNSVSCFKPRHDTSISCWRCTKFLNVEMYFSTLELERHHGVRELIPLFCVIRTRIFITPVGDGGRGHLFQPNDVIIPCFRAEITLLSLVTSSPPFLLEVVMSHSSSPSFQFRTRVRFNGMQKCIPLIVFAQLRESLRPAC